MTPPAAGPRSQTSPAISTSTSTSTSAWSTDSVLPIGCSINCSRRPAGPLASASFAAALTTADPRREARAVVVLMVATGRRCPARSRPRRCRRDRARHRTGARRSRLHRGVYLRHHDLHDMLHPRDTGCLQRGQLRAPPRRTRTWSTRADGSRLPGPSGRCRRRRPPLPRPFPRRPSLLHGQLDRALAHVRCRQARFPIDKMAVTKPWVDQENHLPRTGE